MQPSFFRLFGSSSPKHSVNNTRCLGMPWSRFYRSGAILRLTRCRFGKDSKNHYREILDENILLNWKNLLLRLLVLVLMLPDFKYTHLWILQVNAMAQYASDAQFLLIIYFQLKRKCSQFYNLYEPPVYLCQFWKKLNFQIYSYHTGFMWKINKNKE